MFLYTKIFFISFTIIIATLFSGCVFDRSALIRPTNIKDINLINKGKYLLLIIYEPVPNISKNGEIEYSAILADCEKKVSVNAIKQRPKGLIYVHPSFQTIYIFSDKVASDEFIIKHDIFINSFSSSSDLPSVNIMTEQSLQALLNAHPPLKTYSRKELEVIVQKTPNQNFFLECFIDDSLEFKCESTTKRIR